MPERLEIDVLKTLKAIHDHGGVTSAAQALSLTQSAVSHKIRRLEQHIDCQLLRRKAGQGLLTADGERLVAYAEKIISIHDEALSGINKVELKGRIRLGLTEELVTTELARVLGQFSRLYPGVRVKTEVHQSLELVQLLERSKLDMAVMQMFDSDTRQTDQVWKRIRLVWASSVDYRFPDESRIPFIAFDQNCFYRQWATREFAGADRQLDVVLECASNEGVCSAVSAGMGVALIAEHHLRSDMVAIDILQPPPVSFVIRTARPEPSPSVLALRESIAKEAL